MNNQLSFLKGISIICLSFLLLFVNFNCSTDVDVQMAEMPPPLTDVLTLELSFGDEKTITKDEFLLARPRKESIAVNESGYIYILDEFKIKVYDKDGTEKTIFGGRGNGPGEFNFPRDITIGSTGFLSVSDPIYFNIFDPENKFLYRLDSRKTPRYQSYFKKNNNSRILQTHILSNNQSIASIENIILTDDIPDSSTFVLIFDNNVMLIELANYRMVRGCGRGGMLFYRGSLLYELLTNNRIIFTHSGKDKIINENVYK